MICGECVVREIRIGLAADDADHGGFRDDHTEAADETRILQIPSCSTTEVPGDIRVIV